MNYEDKAKRAASMTPEQRAEQVRRADEWIAIIMRAQAKVAAGEDDKPVAVVV